jgi:membrane protease YdiL (CAAX protease family)
MFSAKVNKMDYLKYGLTNINIKKSFYYLFIWIMIVFPAYFIIIFILKFGGNFKEHIINIKLPKDIAYYIIYNIVVVGFSEEFFYRGYLQPLIQKKFNYLLISKIKLDTGIIITSLIFGLGHFLTYFTIFSALTFLPSIIFGILRNQTNNILASVIFHGISNGALYIIIFNIGKII